MPRLIEAGDGDAIDLDDLVEALDAASFDVADEHSFAALGPLLARLGRNRRFLSDIAIDRLKDGHTDQLPLSSYGAQVMMLRPPNGRYVLRANFWPARDDAVVRASGTAPFFYDMAHDHNFPFLTYGYLGPGYWSDYYEVDHRHVAGVVGEAVALRFVERSRLEPGKLMLYRAHQDVHVQLPPDAFSVSLNILGYDPAQAWRDQYRYDIASGTIAEALTGTPAEALVAVAVHFGGGNGRDLAEEFAARHPNARMRSSAFQAIASLEPSRDGRAAVFARAAGDADPRVAGSARRRLALIENGG